MTKQQLIKELEKIREDTINEKIPYKKDFKIKSYNAISTFVEVLLEKYYNCKYKAKLIMTDEEFIQSTENIIQILRNVDGEQQ